MTVTDQTATSLPPYSGENVACVKCGCEGAITTYRKQGDERAGDFFAVPLGDRVERLERRCPRCRYVWDEALAPASSAGRAPAADRAAVLLEAAEALHAKGKDVCDEDSGECCWFDAVAELRRLAGEPQQDEVAQPDVQVWPLARVLTEVRCGSEDWAWEEEWADLDRRHAETGYLDKLEQQIRKNGITMPVLIGSDGRLWDGHHRLRIAVRLGIGYVPVEITPAREAQQGPTQDGEAKPAPMDPWHILGIESAPDHCTGQPGFCAEHGVHRPAVARPGQPDTDNETPHTGEQA